MFINSTYINFIIINYQGDENVVTLKNGAGWSIHDMEQEARNTLFQRLLDSSSEDENNQLWISELPPAIMVDEDQEDFDELLRFFYN